MTRQLLFICVAVVASLAIPATAGVAAGQEGPGITINQTNSEETETYAQEIDNKTRLMEWSYDDERDGFVLRFETDDSVRITLTEAVQFSEGAGSGRIYQERLPEGQSEVFVSVPRRGGQAAVTMTTRRSIANNRFSYVSTGEAQIDRPPITYQRAQLLVGLSAVGAAGAAFGIVRKRRNDEEKDYERIL